MFSSKFLASVYLAVICAGGALAAPWASEVKHETHRTHLIARGLELETYHPKSTYETYGAGVEHGLTKRADASVQDSTASFLGERLGLKEADFHFRSKSEAEYATHVYVKQQFNGVPVANAVANIAFNKDNKAVAFGSSFVKPTNVASSKPSVDVNTAIKAAEELLGGKFDNHTPTLEYLARDDDTVALTHVVQIKDDAKSLWVEAFVDAHTGKVLSITDFVAKATYRVLPITKEVLTQGFANLADPQDTVASPNGWHTYGSTTTTTTSGNNVITYKSSTSGTTSQSASGQFIYTQDPSAAPTTTANLNAARVNTFYLVNTMHDITYRYGFTEKAFNFQQVNIAAGGAAGDRVQVSVQDASGTDNANFATPADGQSGQMRMFLWDYTTPGRDGALENDIVVHEFTHGVTNRMTGGGTGRCLQSTEAGGMGEGWSDAMAEWTEQTAAIADYTMGTYVINSSKGIRKYPYSTSATVNPLRYSSIKKLNEVHNIGEVWANMLHNVLSALVGAYGFDADAKTTPSSTAGNAVHLHLFLDALLLQPCSPTFVTARDAWIQADANRYEGKNNCLLWKAFASRGLGVGASGYTDSSAVPSGC